MGQPCTQESKKSGRCKHNFNASGFNLVASLPWWEMSWFVSLGNQLFLLRSLIVQTKDLRANEWGPAALAQTSIWGRKLLFLCSVD